MAAGRPPAWESGLEANVSDRVRSELTDQLTHRLDAEPHLHCFVSFVPSVFPNLTENSRVQIYVQNKAAGKGCPH